MSASALLAQAAQLGSELETLAERLRRFTVRVRTRRLGEGSGIIWSPDGLIVSNAHVARDRAPLIELWDRSQFEAELLWRDPHCDLALLAIPANDLTPAVAGDPRALRTGDIVLALGHPFGLPGALSLGVIHRLGPGGSSSGWVRAAIRLAPGNSGGPLANAAGEVVGINTLIAGGLGHAVSVETVQRFLLETGALAA